MAASTEQKLDYLLKKIGYTASKTGLAEDSSLSGTKKAPFAEAIPSPLVTPSTTIWNESALIPTTPPGSDTAQVRVYLAGTSGHRMTVDSTVSGSRAFIAYSTYNNTSTAILGDWIDPQFGDSYIIKVYKGDPNSGGVLLSAAGAGSNDTWFFDYSSGVLNFNGTVIPSGVTDTNIYIVGYRYIGVKGLSTAGITTSGTSVFKNLSVTGVSTFTGNINANGNIIGDNATNISGINSVTATSLFANLTGNVTGIATYTSEWIITSNGSSDYRFTGPGFDGTENDPTIYLTRGQEYKFTNNMGAHPFQIRTAINGSAYNDGVVNNGVSNGTLTWDVQMDAPNVLYYQCTAHAGMVGKIYIGNSGNSINVGSGVTISGNGIVVTGIVTATNFVGVSSVTATDFFGTLQTAAQPNITSVGTLSSLNVTGVSTFTNTVLVNGGSGLQIGDGNASLYRSSNDLYIDVAGNNDFYVRTNSGGGTGGKIYLQPKPGENGIVANSDGSVEIYHDNSKKLETTNTGVVVTGIATATDFSGNISGVGATFTNITGTLQTAAQPNVTSLGTLSSLNVTGDVSIGGTLTYEDVTNIDSVGLITARTGIKVLAGGINAVGVVTATTFSGSGASLTSITNSNLSGSAGITNANLANSTVSYGGISLALGGSDATPAFNLTDATNYPFTSLTGITTTILGDATPKLGGDLNGNGKSIFNVGIITATTFSGDISGVGATFTNITGTLQTAAQPNVTSLGTLTGLTVSGTSTLGITSATNLEAQQLNVTGVATATGLLYAMGGIQVEGPSPSISLIDTNNNPDYIIGNSNGTFRVRNTQSAVDVFTILGTQVDFNGNVDCNSGLDVTGQTNTDTLNVTGVSTFAGNINANGNIVGDNSTNISGINSVTAVKFFGDGEGLTNVGVDTVTVNTDRITTGTLNVTGVSTFAGLAKFNGNFEASGNVTLGDATGDNIDVQGRFVRELVPSSNGDKDLGTSSFRWGTLHVKNILQGGDGTVDVGFSTFREGIFVTGVSTFSNNTGAINAVSTTTNPAINVSLGATVKGSIIPASDGLEIGATSANNISFRLNRMGGNTSDFIVKTVEDELFKIDSGTRESTFISTDTSSSAGPVINLYRNSPSPADADYLGQIKFQGESDTGVQRNYAKITGKILDASNTSEDGIIEFAHIKAGAQTITGRFRSDSLQLLNGTNLSVNGTTTFEDDVTFTGASANIIFDKSGDHIQFFDQAKGKFGTSGDLEIYHQGNINYIDCTTSAQLLIQSDDLRIRNAAGNKEMLIATADGGIDLYFNAAKKLETTNTGVVVTGIVTATSFSGDGSNLSNVGFTTSVGTFNASSGVATIDSFAHATEDYKVAEYTLHFTNGSNIQAQKLLVMQDGTTAHSQEFAVMSSSSQLVTVDATISGANVLVRATPEIGISGTTTFRWRRIVQE